MSSFRHNTLAKPIYRWTKDVVSPLSGTEPEALNAGNVR